MNKFLFFYQIDSSRWNKMKILKLCLVTGNVQYFHGNMILSQPYLIHTSLVTKANHTILFKLLLLITDSISLSSFSSLVHHIDSWEVVISGDVILQSFNQKIVWYQHQIPYCIILALQCHWVRNANYVVNGKIKIVRTTFCCIKQRMALNSVDGVRFVKK